MTSSRSTTTPHVSIVTPTHNRLTSLKRVLSALERQSYPLDQFEVIVVSDGSTDGTDEYLRLVPVFQQNGGPAAARNAGIERASGSIVLFIDDDVVPERQLIAEHLSLHTECPSRVVVLGPMLDPPDFAMTPWVRWEQNMLGKQYTAMQEGHWEPTARQFYTGNTSLARCHLAAVGGFDAAFRRAEDVELAFRLELQGLRFVFNPRAYGYHYAERSFRSWMEIPYTYGRNDVIFAREKHLTWILPNMRSEFRNRNLFIRILTHLCLGRPALSAAILSWLTALSGADRAIGPERVHHAALSAIFNLRYYQGMADELGGRQQFLLHVRR
jgi:glycosyltransferase involved in cell wall biosynthesis